MAEENGKRSMESSHSKSITSSELEKGNKHLPTWLKVGAVAAASAVVGGLAAAWFYRGTLKRLRNPELHAENSNFGINSDHKNEDF